MKSAVFSLGSILLIMAVVFSVAWLAIYVYRQGNKGRRSPLTGKLLRSPGQSLIPQINEISEKVEEVMFGLFMIPLATFAVLMGELYWGLLKPTLGNIGMMFFFALAGMLFLARRLSRSLKRRNELRLGLDAEMAVGQELNQLMLQGCHVYHDFPAEEFNIDHVVVGPGGVFAVETKGRAKPDKGRGALDAKVVYDGEELRFPDWNETKPIDQAKRQAVWLSKWLSSAVGVPVATRPALALPGWFVERTKPGNVILFNGKNPQFLSKSSREGQLTAEMIQRISHQLEQRCRDVEPAGYRKDKK